MLRRFIDSLSSVVMGKYRSKGGYYAVRIGRSTGVFHSWEECQQAVNGYSGARFKKFGSLEEASNFVGGCDSGYSEGSSSCDSYSIPGCESYSRPAKYTNYSNSVHRPRNTFKHTTRQTQYIDHLPSTSSYTFSESTSKSERPVVYSDGCCTSNGRCGAKAGVGVYWGPDSKSNISERLSGTQTNQRAEIMAACRAIESAKSRGYKSVEIRTDSKYTINGATNWVKKWKANGWKTANNTDVKNIDDFKKLDKLCGEMDVKWTHVAGHSGNHGNDMADSLAKAGSQLP